MRPLLLRIDRLVAATVLGAIALVWFTLVGLDTFIAFARELGDADGSGYTAGVIALYIALTIPHRAYVMFGTAAVIGGLLGLGALAPTAELTAMRAGGMSKLRICLSALAGVAVLTGLVMLMAETLAPWGQRAAQALAAEAKSGNRITAGNTGLWAREGESLINARGGETTATGVRLSDVRIYEFTPQGQLTRITQARQATHGGARWELSEVTRMRFGTESVSTEALPALAWNSTLDPQVLALSVVRPHYLAMRDLARNIQYMQRNRLDAVGFEAAYWARVFYPLNVLALLLCALPFAFGALRSGGMAKRLFLGMLLAVAWFLFQRTAVNVAQVYAVDLRLANLLPGLALLAAALVYFRRST